MIQGFEYYTKELSREEQEKIYPLILDILQGRIGKERAISNQSIITILANYGYTTITPRVRKIIHAIRISGDVKGLIANSRGYYIAESIPELSDYISSLESRGRSIMNVAESLKKQRGKIK